MSKVFNHRLHITEIGIKWCMVHDALWERCMNATQEELTAVQKLKIAVEALEMIIEWNSTTREGLRRVAEIKSVELARQALDKINPRQKE